MMEGKTEFGNQTDRLAYIDGIRGVAAILVVFCHISCVFCPGLYFLDRAESSLELCWLNSPLNIITNGDFSVQCFFVFSGFLITRKVYKGKGALGSPVKIYTKLLHIVVPAVLLACVFMRFGMMKHLDAARINPLLSFVNDYNNFGFGTTTLIKELFFRPFFTGSKFVGPLWTIKYELLGSVMTYMMAWFAMNNRYRTLKIYLPSAVLAYAFLPQYCISFIIGAIACDCVWGGDKSTDSLWYTVIQQISNRKALQTMVLLCGCYLASCNLTLTGIYKPLSFLLLGDVVFRALGIAICLVFIAKNDFAQNLFEKKGMVLLGKISPYIYAFHWPIELSLGCGIYILLSNIRYEIAVVFVLIVVLFASSLLAILYMKVVLPYVQLLEKKVGAIGGMLVNRKLRKQRR